jgi:5'-3' exonuclease
MAALRGDPSDGLPGVPGIGEKTAASLLRRFRDLAGVRAAVEDLNSGLAPRLRVSLREASEYLDRAPRVVRVVTDLPVPPPPHVQADPDLPLLDAIGAEFGIANSIGRILQALGVQR